MKKITIFFILVVIISGLIFSLDIYEARELLMNEKGGEIYFLSKINLGIPSGENWIANRIKDDATYIYTIDSDKKVTFIDASMIMEQSEIKFWETSNNSYRDLEFNIFEGVLGIQLGGKAAKFGDFDGDGKDEFFIISPSFEPHGYNCYIKKYSDSEKKMIFPFSCNFEIYYFEEMHPVFITNYQEKYCIAVEEPFGGPGLWHLFAWNEETNEYEEIKTLMRHEIDFSTFKVIEKNEIESEPEAAEYTVITTEDEQLEKLSNFVIENKKSKLIILLASIFTVVAIIIILVVRKKRII